MEATNADPNSQAHHEETLPTRKDFLDYVKMMKEGRSRSKIDEDGDRRVFIKDIPKIMELLNEPKISEDKLKNIIAELNLAEGEDETTMEIFMQAVVPFLENYGSKDEFVEAFKVLDEHGTGEIPVNKFRYFMLEYGEVDPAMLDQLIMDIFGMKKNAPLDPDKPIVYKEFASKLFDPPPPKNQDKGKGKGKGKGK